MYTIKQPLMGGTPLSGGGGGAGPLARGVCQQKLYQSFGMIFALAKPVPNTKKLFSKKTWPRA